MRFIDCMSHKLSAAAIFEAAGIHMDGRVDRPGIGGRPESVCLLVTPGTGLKKLGSMRSTLSQESKMRFFEIKALPPITSFWKVNGIPVPAEYITVHFAAGRNSMRVAAAVRSLMQESKQ